MTTIGHGSFSKRRWVSSQSWGTNGASPGTFYCLGSAYIGLKEYAKARWALEESVARTEELGTKGDTGEALEKLGKVAYFPGGL